MRALAAHNAHSPESLVSDPTPLRALPPRNAHSASPSHAIFQLQARDQLQQLQEVSREAWEQSLLIEKTELENTRAQQFTTRRSKITAPPPAPRTPQTALSPQSVASTLRSVSETTVVKDGLVFFGSMSIPASPPWRAPPAASTQASPGTPLPRVGTDESGGFVDDLGGGEWPETAGEWKARKAGQGLAIAGPTMPVALEAAESFHIPQQQRYSMIPAAGR